MPPLPPRQRGGSANDLIKSNQGGNTNKNKRMASTINQRAARKLIDYTQRGKQINQESLACVSVPLHHDATSTSSCCTPSSIRSPIEPLSSSSDSLQPTLGLLLRASSKCLQAGDHLERVEFMLKIPNDFSSRAHSDLRERFLPTAHQRDYRPVKRYNQIEATLSRPSTSRRLIGRRCRAASL